VRLGLGLVIEEGLRDGREGRVMVEGLLEGDGEEGRAMADGLDGEGEGRLMDGGREVDGEGRDTEGRELEGEGRDTEGRELEGEGRDTEGRELDGEGRDTEGRLAEELPRRESSPRWAWAANGRATTQAARRIIAPAALLKGKKFGFIT
jgi:hypothetical protein